MGCKQRGANFGLTIKFLDARFYERGGNHQVFAIAINTCLVHGCFTAGISAVKIGMVCHQVVQILLGRDAEYKEHQYHACKDPSYDWLICQLKRCCKIKVIYSE